METNGTLIINKYAYFLFMIICTFTVVMTKGKKVIGSKKTARGSDRFFFRVMVEKRSSVKKGMGPQPTRPPPHARLGLILQS